MKKTSIPPIRRYYRQTCRIIPKKYPHRKDTLSSIYQDISSYTTEHPDITYEDLMEHFGTPEDMALSFAETLSSADVMNASLKTKKRNRIIISIAIIIFLLSCGVIHRAYRIAKSAIVEVEETTIIYQETEVDNENSVHD